MWPLCRPQRSHCWNREIQEGSKFGRKYNSSSSSSSSSIGATTLGGFWPALRFCSTVFYLYTSLSSFSLASSLNPLLLVRAISVLVFLLVLMNMVPIQLIFWRFLLCPFWLHELPSVIFVILWILQYFFFLIRISNFSFVFILHVPSLFCVGPYISLSTLLSNISISYHTNEFNKNHFNLQGFRLWEEGWNVLCVKTEWSGDILWAELLAKEQVAHLVCTCYRHFAYERAWWDAVKKVQTILINYIMCHQ